MTAYAAGSFIVPVLGAGQPGFVLVASGVVMAVAGVGAVVLLGRYAIVEPVLDPRARVLAEVEMFAGLQPARIEAALRAARIVAMQPGEVIIRQGDPADNFYVIAEGEVEVTQTMDMTADSTADDTKARVLRRLGRGQFFGEIGLLSRVPRTATVTAVSGGSLVVLGKDDFLQLVSAGSGLTYGLLNFHRGTISGAGAAELTTDTGG